MRIISWNVNGIRAVAKKGFRRFLTRSEADLVCVQETRAHVEQLPRKLVKPRGWQTHFVEPQRKGYSGVGAFFTTEPDGVTTSLGEERFDVEGRLQFLEFGDLLVVNGYFPNGSGRNRDHSRVPYKLDFYRTLFDRLEDDRAAGRPILVMGDFNTAPYPIDLARPKQNKKTSGFLQVERDELIRWLDNGWSDTFRMFETGGEHYSWWSQRKGVREKNIGWRIDLVLASPGAVPLVENAFIWPDVKGSDHCPIGVDLRFPAG